MYELTLTWNAMSFWEDSPNPNQSPSFTEPTSNGSSMPPEPAVEQSHQALWTEEFLPNHRAKASNQCIFWWNDMDTHGMSQGLHGQSLEMVGLCWCLGDWEVPVRTGAIRVFLFHLERGFELSNSGFTMSSNIQRPKVNLKENKSMLRMFFFDLGQYSKVKWNANDPGLLL